MKKILLVIVVIPFLTSMLWAEERIEAPIWNVSDKWVFTPSAAVEVMTSDPDGYVVKFSGDILENKKLGTIILERSTLNRIYSLQEEKRIKYTGVRKRVLNFPLGPGKQWQDEFSGPPLAGPLREREMLQFAENFNVMGWELAETRAGKFKALKIEYRQRIMGPSRLTEFVGKEGLAWYWYSPEVKYFVKAQYARVAYWQGFKDWELTSFEIKR